MSSRRPPRLLSDDEIELWLAVAKSITPHRHSSLPMLPPTPEPAPRRMEPALAQKPPPRVGYSPPYTPPQSQPKATLPPIALLERKYKRRVTRGQVSIGRVLDLHGLNQAEAHHTLRGFLRGAQRDDVRLVLVVTGKGQRARPSDGGFGDAAGVLRRAVPHWLREPDLRPIVLSFEEASQPHGGTGALYIQLRRRGEG